jgi:hypothetical protein
MADGLIVSLQTLVFAGSIADFTQMSFQSRV